MTTYEAVRDVVLIPLAAGLGVWALGTGARCLLDWWRGDGP